MQSHPRMQAGDPGPSGAGDYDAQQQLDPTPASEIADTIGPQAERNTTGGVAIRIVGAGVSAQVVPFKRPTSQHHRMVSPITFAGECQNRGLGSWTNGFLMES